MITNLSFIKKFHKVVKEESQEKISNPGIGWYHLYTFDVGCKDPELYIACEEEQIVLLLIDISDFRENVISTEALMSVRQIFQFFAEHQKDMIVRFVYDTEGRGMEKEPESGALILEHIRALGNIVKEYENCIMVWQGILVGNWGEMHGSRFLSEKWMIKLVRAVLEATDYCCPLAVRKPSQLRKIAEHLGREAAEKLTVFNDGIFGSKTDLGTYGSGIWNRKNELAWQNEHLEYSYVGGEVLEAQNLAELYDIDGEEAEKDLRQMHVSYLNSVHQKELLERWKNEKMTWQQREISAYDYIGAHLGYRFVVRDVKWKKNCLLIAIENTGFANLCEEAVCKLIIELNGKKQEKEISTDPGKWDSKKETILEVELTKEEQAKGSQYFLQLYRRKDGRKIQFANKTAEEEILLGKF